MQLPRRLSDAETQEKELDRSTEQACTRRKAWPQAAVSSLDCASAGTDATRYVAGSSRRDVERVCGLGHVCNTRPAAQKRIKFRDQLRGPQRHHPLGSLPYLIHETTNRLLLGIGI